MIKWINKKRNKKGFTLIELIVVVAILGILAAIAIPRFTASRQNAERSSVEANLRTIDSAIMVYLAEKDSDADAPAEANLVTDYIAAWPKGPGTAEYDVNEDLRAVVSGNAGGETGMTNLTVENLPWNTTTTPPTP